MSRKKTTEKGSIVVVAMLAMVALISLAGLSTLAVRGGLASSGHERFRSIALYAAEGGAAAAIDYLRSHVHADINIGWSDYVNAKNLPPFFTEEIPGNRKKPGELGNLFSPDVQAWYDVVILNNLDDTTGFNIGEDHDQRVVIRSTGYGPGGAVAQIEVEITVRGLVGGLAPLEGGGQKNIDAANSGFESGDALNNPGDQRIINADSLFNP